MNKGKRIPKMNVGVAQGHSSQLCEIPIDKELEPNQFLLYSNPSSIDVNFSDSISFFFNKNEREKVRKRVLCRNQ